MSNQDPKEEKQFSSWKGFQKGILIGLTIMTPIIIILHLIGI